MWTFSCFAAKTVQFGIKKKKIYKEMKEAFANCDETRLPKLNQACEDRDLLWCCTVSKSAIGFSLCRSFLSLIRIRGLQGLTITSMFPKTFHWGILALNSVSVICNTCSLKCVLGTFNTEVTLFRILMLDGIVSLAFSFASALTHGLSGIGFLSEGQVKCSLILMTTMPAYINGILCSLMVSVMR